LKTEVGGNMNELVPYNGLFYQLNEAGGEFSCVIFAEGEDVAIWKTDTFENPELAISEVKGIIDEFNEYTKDNNDLN
jgi:hypothetical protein